MNTRPWGSRAGISLIELLVAMVILAVAIVATVGVLFGTGVHNEKGKNQALATKQCQEIMEMLRSMPYDQMIQPGSFDNIAGQPAPVIITANQHFKGFFLVKPPLFNNQWIGEFEVRDCTQDHMAEINTASPAARSALTIQPTDRWLVAEITVRLKTKDINVLLKTRKKA